MTEEILSAIRKRRKDERIWRKSKLTVDQEIYRNSCLLIKEHNHRSKDLLYSSQISNCKGDPKNLFGIVNLLLGKTDSTSSVRL